MPPIMLMERSGLLSSDLFGKESILNARSQPLIVLHDRHAKTCGTVSNCTTTRVMFPD
jgi:hypothetical protein